MEYEIPGAGASLADGENHSVFDFPIAILPDDERGVDKNGKKQRRAKRKRMAKGGVGGEPSLHLDPNERRESAQEGGERVEISVEASSAAERI